MSRIRYNRGSASVLDPVLRPMEPVPLRPEADEVALSDPRNFINRELSNFTFIERILDEAEDRRAQANLFQDFWQ